MNAVIVELNTTTQAYNEAIALHREYMSNFEFLYDYDDDAIFEALVELEANKSANLNIAELEEAKTLAENNAIEALTGFINDSDEEVDSENLQIANETIALSSSNWKARKQVLELAIESFA